MKKLLVLMLLLRSLTLLPADATFSDDLLQRAKAGDAEAQFTLGYVYSNGAGVAKDRAEAIKWYRQAADQDFLGAYWYLGWMYCTEGAEQDLAEAEKWFRKAAEKGDWDSKVMLHR